MGCACSIGKQTPTFPKLPKDDSPRTPLQDATHVSGEFGPAPFTPTDTSGLLGVVKVCVKGGKFPTTGHYNVTLSQGMQSFITKTSKRTKQPQFAAERNVVILKSAHVMHLMVHCLKAGKFLAIKRTPIGVATIDVLSLFPDLESSDGESSKSVDITLRRPEASQLKEDIEKALPKRKAAPNSCPDEPASIAGDPDPVIGTITVVFERTSIEQLKQSLWSGLLQIVDWDDSGTLDREVFSLHAAFFALLRFVMTASISTWSTISA